MTADGTEKNVPRNDRLVRNMCIIDINTNMCQQLLL